MNVKHWLAIADRFGLHAALQTAGYGLLNRGELLRFYVVLCREQAPAPSAASDEFRFGPIERASLDRMAAEQPDVLSPQFVADALSRGDRCFGVTLGDGRLISFAWYSRQTIRLDGDLAVAFNDAYYYHYHAYTEAAYRGRQLHGYAMDVAAAALAAPDVRGMLTLVEADNFPSLQSFRRNHFAVVGYLSAIKLRGRSHCWASSGARRYGCTIHDIGCAS